MRNKMIHLLLIAFLVLSCKQKDHAWQIKSPSGKIEVKVLHQEGKVYYEVNSVEEGIINVLQKSPLGVIRNDGDFSNNLRLDNAGEVHQINDKYSMISGKQKDLSYTANEFELTFLNDQNKKISVVFRAFDDGIAFRYVFPEKDSTIYTITSETTGFSLPVGIKAWMSAYELAKPWGQPGYESDYLEVASGTSSPDSVGWAFPMLFKNNNHWVFISEAGLEENYCGCHINKDCPEGMYTIAFPQHEERYGDGNVEPSSSLPWNMPWRFISIGKDLQTIYESNLVYHLSNPSEVADISWIKPGRASWEWWSSTSGRTVKKLKDFIDLAAEMNWEYSLVDAGWESMPDGKIEEVIDYAKKKNIGLILWYNSGGRRDSSQKSEDFEMYVPEAREKEMARIEQLGIKGIKVDFFATDKQDVIKLYLDILKDAARHHLIVDFHGSTLPRGWNRTYPNLLSMEAVRGAECYRFSEPFPSIAARYNTLGTLIRNAIGSADYTPATFSNQKYPHLTTYGHELALTVVYESGIVHMADQVEAYRKLSKESKQFLKNVPASWDESKLIQAIPGELFIIARKKGNDWYIAGVNGKSEVQEAVFSLPFGLKKAKILADGNNMTKISFQEQAINKNEKVTIKMLPHGGFVITGKE